MREKNTYAIILTLAVLFTSGANCWETFNLSISNFPDLKGVTTNCSFILDATFVFYCYNGFYAVYSDTALFS